MYTTNELSEMLINSIQEVLIDKGLDIELTLDSPVDQTLGLDSLDWAAVAVQMEEKSGLDPFSEGIQGQLNNIADLLSLYEQMASKQVR